MSSAPQSALAPEEIARDATWLAQALDPNQGMMRFVAMDRDSYRAASFLDDRLMQTPVNAEIVPWPQVETAMAGDLRCDARWIFHIGHVGSTLVSRLLGEIDGVLAIREPRLLRDLALSPLAVRAGYVAVVPKLMSRTFAANQRACVKATSFASEIAPQLVPAGECALFLYARPRNYVATILAGENSVKELHALEDYRRKRLARRGISFAPPANDAERAAAAWACEMTTLEDAASIMTDRPIAWEDFDAMLADIAAALGRICRLFGVAVEGDRLAAIAAGPIMRLYSKDPIYDYSPELREQLIEQELRLQAPRIDGALAMLSRAAEKSELLARALSRGEG
jgi:hypothetical protein